MGATYPCRSTLSAVSTGHRPSVQAGVEGSVPVPMQQVGEKTPSGESQPRDGDQGRKGRQHRDRGAGGEDDATPLIRRDVLRQDSGMQTHGSLPFFSLVAS